MGRWCKTYRWNTTFTVYVLNNWKLRITHGAMTAEVIWVVVNDEFLFVRGVIPNKFHSWLRYSCKLFANHPTRDQKHRYLRQPIFYMSHVETSRDLIRRLIGYIETGPRTSDGHVTDVSRQEHFRYVTFSSCSPFKLQLFCPDRH